MKFSVYITGSNAKMLSTDVASTLGGRFMVKELYPYSFREFLVASGLALSQGLPKSTAEKARVAAAFHPFLNYGGLPEILDVSIKLDYLNNVYKTIFLGDIVRRKRIRDPEGVAVLLKKITKAVTKPISVNRLKNTASDVGFPMSPATVMNYLSFVSNS